MRQDAREDYPDIRTESKMVACPSPRRHSGASSSGSEGSSSSRRGSREKDAADAVAASSLDLLGYSAQRRMSAALMTPNLMALTEADTDGKKGEELSFDLVCLGGGVVAGYWADEIGAIRKERGEGGDDFTAAIISAYPSPLAPYERPACSKGFLDSTLDADKARDPAQGGFPFTCKGSGGQPHDESFYDQAGITLLHSFQAFDADLDAKYLLLRRVILSAGTAVDSSSDFDSEEEEEEAEEESSDGQQPHSSSPDAGPTAAPPCLKVVYKGTVKVFFKQLVVATGSRPRHLSSLSPNHTRSTGPCLPPAQCHPSHGPSQSPPRSAIESACFSTRHTDLKLPSGAEGEPAPSASPALLGRYGFGSVHVLKDWGDSVKLLAAMRSSEAEAQELCRDSVLVAGAGFVAVEAAAAIATHCPDVRVTMVLPGKHIYAPSKRGSGLGLGVGFSETMASAYEKHMIRAGVQFARGYRVERLWGLEESGSFCTLEGPPNSLKRTMPRPFLAANPLYFSECRGLVLRSTEDGEEVRMPGRFVVLGIGSLPNSDLFQGKLALAPDQSIRTDSSLRTSHPSGRIFAAGDVATFPMQGGGREGDGRSGGGVTEGRVEHVENARSMARYVARAMLSPSNGSHTGNSGSPDTSSRVTDEQLRPYHHVPFFYSKFLGLNWMFAGSMVGEAVTLGLQDFGATKRFGVFWVHTRSREEGGREDERPRVCGAFLEGGVEGEKDVLEHIARERPVLLTTKSLSKISLDAFLADPHCLTPQELGKGEFYADTDPESVLAAFRKYEVSGQGMQATVRCQDVGRIMALLGANWVEAELADAVRGMDPLDSGYISQQSFTKWWMG